MSDHDLMDDESRLDSEKLRQRSERLLLYHEWAIAVQYDENNYDGFLTVWIQQDHPETTNPQYEREFGYSAPYEVINAEFAKMAKDPDAVTDFLGRLR